jgi:hypothetical protein
MVRSEKRGAPRDADHILQMSAVRVVKRGKVYIQLSPALISDSTPTGPSGIGHMLHGVVHNNRIDGAIANGALWAFPQYKGKPVARPFSRAKASASAYSGPPHPYRRYEKPQGKQNTWFAGGAAAHIHTTLSWNISTVVTFFK